MIRYRPAACMRIIMIIHGTPITVQADRKSSDCMVLRSTLFVVVHRLPSSDTLVLTALKESSTGPCKQPSSFNPAFLPLCCASQFYGRLSIYIRVIAAILGAAVDIHLVTTKLQARSLQLRLYSIVQGHSEHLTCSDLDEKADPIRDPESAERPTVYRGATYSTAATLFSSSVYVQVSLYIVCYRITN